MLMMTITSLGWRKENINKKMVEQQQKSEENCFVKGKVPTKKQYIKIFERLKCTSGHLKKRNKK